MNTIKTHLSRVTGPYRSRSGLRARVFGKIFPGKPGIRIGIPLVILMAIAAVMVPEAKAGFDSTAVYYAAGQTGIPSEITDSGFQWPFMTFGISQHFSPWHPGIDLTNPGGTPVHPISGGTVTEALSEADGYGKHVIVSHGNSVSSLYAHFSRIDVKVGQTVTTDTVLGGVGATGHATGNHLHMEIHKLGLPVDPLVTLPEIRKDEGAGSIQVTVIPAIPSLTL